MTLQAKLDAFKADFDAGKPPYSVAPEVAKTLWRAVAELVASGAADLALKVGDQAPSFVLEDTEGRSVSSSKLLAGGPLAVSFYRGVWCPFCNMEMQALQETLPDIRAAGGEFVAISPQTKVNSRKSQRENAIEFPILMDRGNELAAAFGLRFKLRDYIIDLYKQFDTDLAIINGEDSWTLPMPARYVIGRDRKILYAAVDADYTRRPEPEDMLPVLRQHARNTLRM
jgi:peroxiredoxin